MEMEGQKRVVFDGNLISKRDAILESFSTKFRTQTEIDGHDNLCDIVYYITIYYYSILHLRSYIHARVVSPFLRITQLVSHPQCIPME